MEAEKNVDLGSSDYTTVAATILEGVGGAANIKSIDNCITRLRLEVKDSSLVDEKKIKSAGAAGVIRPSKTYLLYTSYRDGSTGISGRRAASIRLLSC